MDLKKKKIRSWDSVQSDIALKTVELFKSQIKAILRASAFGDIKIMFPLITTMDELREGKKLVAECKADLRNMGDKFLTKTIQVGVMVETASAAVIADMLAKEGRLLQHRHK